MRVIGIDPGAGGGVAWIDTGREAHRAAAVAMPAGVGDLLSLLRSLAGGGPVLCFLEDVGHGMPGQSSKATATFARHCGHVEMALVAAGVPVEKVSAARWQNHLRLRSRPGESRSSHKGRIKGAMQQRWPALAPVVTLATADALAIATYGAETAATRGWITNPLPVK